MAETLHETMLRVRRETLRWMLLLTLHVARPESASLALIRPVIAATYSDVTEREIKVELSYLGDRELVKVEIDSHGTWHSKLTRFGVDVVEYTVPVEPGIARPAKG